MSLSLKDIIALAGEAVTTPAKISAPSAAFAHIFKVRLRNWGVSYEEE